jgi:hypothetical protein
MKHEKFKTVMRSDFKQVFISLISTSPTSSPVLSSLCPLTHTPQARVLDHAQAMVEEQKLKRNPMSLAIMQVLGKICISLS